AVPTVPFTGGILLGRSRHLQGRLARAPADPDLRCQRIVANHPVAGIAGERHRAMGRSRLSRAPGTRRCLLRSLRDRRDPGRQSSRDPAIIVPVMGTPERRIPHPTPVRSRRDFARAGGLARPLRGPRDPRAAFFLLASLLAPALASATPPLDHILVVI